MSGSLAHIPLGDTEQKVVDILRTLSRNECLEKFYVALKDAAAKAEERGAAASVSLKVSIKPDPKAEAMRMSADISSKLPKEPVRESLFFRTVEGNLSRTDPNQREMFVEN